MNSLQSADTPLESEIDCLAPLQVIGRGKSVNHQDTVIFKMCHLLRYSELLGLDWVTFWATKSQIIWIFFLHCSQTQLIVHLNNFIKCSIWHCSLVLSFSTGGMVCTCVGLQLCPYDSIKWSCTSFLTYSLEWQMGLSSILAWHLLLLIPC